MENSIEYRGKFTKVKTAKKRSNSSSKWLSRQLNDPYVAKSKIENYRSRAAYKLIEINQKFNIFSKNSLVVDLGAAPGGWSQVASDIIDNSRSATGKIVAVDLLPMDSIPGVQFLEANFLEPETKNWIILNLGGKADIVLSDMAANTTGHKDTDHIRIMNLCDDAFNFALEILNPGGHFVAKIFRGGAENEMLNKVKKNFSKVKHFKPLSSRKESSEFYLIALDKKC